MVDTISVNPGGGQTLRLDIFLTHDQVGGLVGHGFSVNFDVDLLTNELNLDLTQGAGLGATSWFGSDVDPGPVNQTYGPIVTGIGTTIESEVGTAGRINTFDSASLGATLPPNAAAYSVGTFTATAPARYRVAQIWFTVNASALGTINLFSGLFDGADAILSSDGFGIPGGSLNFGTATINIIPEPGTVSLLGLGLVGLVLAGRRSRRS